MKRRTWIIGSALSALLALSACGDDSGGGGEDTTTSADTDSTTGGTDATGTDTGVTTTPDTQVGTDAADTSTPEDTEVAEDTADTSTPEDTEVAEDTADTSTPEDAEVAEDTADTSTPEDAEDTADTTPADTTPEDTTPADTTPEDTATADTGVEETVASLTWDDIYPIFRESCVPCHQGSGTPTSGSGGHAIAAADKAVAYQAATKNVSANAPAKCAGKKVAECAILRIQDGSMPLTGECAQTPPGAKCPTAEEQDMILEWIEAGMPE